MPRPATSDDPLVRFLDRFLPSESQLSSPRLRIRARALVIASATAVVLSLAGLTSTGGSLPPSLVAGLTAGFASVPFVLRLVGRYEVAAWWFVVLGGITVTAALVLTGGLHSVHAVWLPVMPAVVLGLLDHRAALGSFVLLGGLVLALLVAETADALPAFDMAPGEQSLAIARISMAGALLFLITSFARERTLAQVQVRQVEEERLRARAEAANRAKSSILASVSHELRTPLTGILGLAELLQHSRVDEEQGSWIRTIRRTGRALLALLDDLLDTARLDAGRMALDERPFRPGELCDQVVSLFQPRAWSRGLELHLELASGLPDRLRGDPARLRQVLVNLVGNAIKFTEEGGVSLRAAWIMDHLLLEVTDTGPGIPPDRLRDMFSPFVRGNETTTSVEGGVGLGLSIAQLLVEAMRGEIRVRSREGVGTTFEVWVPLEVVPADEASQDTSSFIALSSRRRRVLVAEDNEVNRLVLSRMLEKLGHEVEMVSRGDEVLPCVEAFDPEVVLMDVRMPGMDGLEATRRLRRDDRWRDVRVIALTANAFDEDRDACFAAGMDAFLTKPVGIEQLRMALEPPASA